jgi:hypothetical protein
MIVMQDRSNDRLPDHRIRRKLVNSRFCHR